MENLIEFFTGFLHGKCRNIMHEYVVTEYHIMRKTQKSVIRTELRLREM